ncbi:DUF6470 family protein [Desulfosporosinus meridiei]|uniref:Uncharacterized protein n=1 Tax=Desulfosporosinus meridiei (strain ATCC BAA-275 / DSM 13257 / KCTC 12902 / NCIMB 13706 / S10) TaxID=768704 RepID=J7IVB5_DESMD|nr:DUF6470 family protein [Desulfosporosinus meridiei]AFQ45767.1 hypothetical protein Desmer_3931 [Desulfosporosinus meridiei DSM 13257]
MLQINISTQPIRLDYTNNSAKLSRQTTQPKVEIETTPPTVEIYQPRGELTIDQYPCRYSIGLKNIADFARDNAALGRQTAMDAIARIAQEGNQLARIESKTDAIVDIAANSALSEAPEITYAYIESPEIHYQANPVQFNPKYGKVELNLKRGTIEGNYQPGSVNVQVTQYPSVEISFVDVKV